MAEPARGCTLCGFTLSQHPHHYTEGDFCEDVAGCRRRALHLMEELRARTDQELERRLWELAPQVEKTWVEVARLVHELAELARKPEGPPPGQAF